MARAQEIASPDEISARVRRDVMVFCSAVAALHAGASKSDEYNKAAHEIATKLIELSGQAKPVGRAA